MKLSLVERETILLYNQAEPMAEIYTHDPRLMEKLDLLAKKHPDQITRKDAHNFTVPKRCVSVREPYPHSAAYAREHRELEQYRVSNNANLQCKESIEAAVREHFDGMYLSHDAAKGVIETYGMERVALVLANTVQLQDWDGRYSRRNKEWAKTIPNDNPETVRCGYVLNSHPAVLDGFIDLVREEQQRSRTQGEKIQPSRPSVRDKLKQELPAHKPAAPKKQGPER